jgi:hypothetical protein
MARRTMLALLAIALGACQMPIQAHHDVDRNARFERYETFAWVTERSMIESSTATSGGGVPVSPLLDPLVRRAVERNLVAKGYRQVADPGAADLAIAFSVGARDRIDVDSFPARAGYRYGPYGSGPGWSSDVQRYTEGVLAIDVFDRVSKGAVWHGWATRRLYGPLQPEERVEVVEETVDAILASFPPRPGAGA